MEREQPATVVYSEPFQHAHDLRVTGDVDGVEYWLMRREYAQPPKVGDKGRLYYDLTIGARGRYCFAPNAGGGNEAAK